MSLFWDLHSSLEHMNHNGIVPDLVTYGCVIAAYLDRKLGRNLHFALRKMNVKYSPVVMTDQIVFDVLGKGDFHSSSEALSEFKRKKKWTYMELIVTRWKVTRALRQNLERSCNYAVSSSISDAESLMAVKDSGHFLHIQ
ncbi:hypothetical protein Tco_1490918, partial [Tanacetum coccineum]